MKRLICHPHKARDRYEVSEELLAQDEEPERDDDEEPERSDEPCHEKWSPK